tara:strand:+ start:53 stop:601 length:549 start_codon:yes stop_codon:yes gene_type:complete
MAGTEFKLVRSDFTFRGPELQEKVNKKKKTWMSRTGAVVRKIARRSMKKAPNEKTKSGKSKNLTRFGGYQKIKSGQRKGEQRFKKGLHSPPGMPPYHRGGSGNLRAIKYEVGKNNDSVSVFTMATGGGKTISKPPAILQEAGGTAKIRGQRKASQFPARPYITPASVKGLEYMRKVVKEGIK